MYMIINGIIDSYSEHLFWGGDGGKVINIFISFMGYESYDQGILRYLSVSNGGGCVLEIFSYPPVVNPVK